MSKLTFFIAIFLCYSLFSSDESPITNGVGFLHYTNPIFLDYIKMIEHSDENLINIITSASNSACHDAKGDEKMPPLDKKWQSDELMTLIRDYYKQSFSQQKAREKIDIKYLKKIIMASGGDNILEVIHALLIKMNTNNIEYITSELPKVLQVKSPEEALLIAIYLYEIGSNQTILEQYLYQLCNLPKYEDTVSVYDEFLRNNYPHVLNRLISILNSYRENTLWLTEREFLNEYIHYLNQQKDKNPLAGIIWGIYLQGKNDDYQNAKKYYINGLAQMPQMSQLIAEMAEKQEDNIFAQACYDYAIKNGDYSACLLLSISLMLDGKNDEAYDVALLGMQNNIELCRFLVALGMSRQGKDMKDILNTIGSITSNEEKKYLVNALMGELYLSQRNYPEAIRYFSVADEINNFKDIKPKKKLFHIYVQQKDKRNAQKMGEQIIAITNDRELIGEINKTLNEME